MSETVRPSPILKWAGGKAKLVSEILPLLPDRARTYYEPFIGGGAVFFALAAEKRFRNAVLGDQNPELVDLYCTVRDELEVLIDALSEHEPYAKDPEYYYELRALDTSTLDAVQRSARLLFMNKTCFNGLYRVNKSGKFNVPFGKYKKPRVLNEPLLRAASKALKGVTVLNADFGALAAEARAGDAIYFDPPYVPVSATASFTAYSNTPFGPPEQERLAEAYRRCCKRGVTAVLSNSDCAETRALYQGLDVRTVQMTRAINSNAARRGKVNEVLVAGMPQVASRRRAKPVAQRRSA